MELFPLSVARELSNICSTRACERASEPVGVHPLLLSFRLRYHERHQGLDNRDASLRHGADRRDDGTPARSRPLDAPLRYLRRPDERDRLDTRLFRNPAYNVGHSERRSRNRGGEAIPPRAAQCVQPRVRRMSRRRARSSPCRSQPAPAATARQRSERARLAARSRYITCHRDWRAL